MPTTNTQEASALITSFFDHSRKSVSLRRYQDTKFEHLAAGIAGGVTSSAILHPLDTIRTRLAVSGSTSIIAGMERPHYSGFINALASITKQNGFFGLYRGVTLSIVSAGCTWGSYFFIYDALKTQFQKQEPDKPLGPVLRMAAAAEAGTITLILTNPIWVIKTRLCLQFGHDGDHRPETKRYKGIKDAFAKTYRYEGTRGLYRGLVPGAVCVTHTALQFMIYEEMKNKFNLNQQKPIDSQMDTVTYLSLAAISKMMAVTATYPYQLLRTRMQDQFHHYTGVVDILSRTWRFEGMRGFYKGMLPNLLRVTPATAITFFVYENVSRYLIDLNSNSRVPNTRTTQSLAPPVVSA